MSTLIRWTGVLVAVVAVSSCTSPILTCDQGCPAGTTCEVASNLCVRDDAADAGGTGGGRAGGVAGGSAGGASGEVDGIREELPMCMFTTVCVSAQASKNGSQ